MNKVKNERVAKIALIVGVIAAILLVVTIFTAISMYLSRDSNKEEVEISSTETDSSNAKRGISSVIEDSLDSNDISGITKHVEDTVRESPVDIEEDEEEKVKVQQEGWTSANLNVREQPNKDSNILDVLPFNTPIEYYEYDDEWAEIAFDNGQAYVNRNYISDEECNFVIFNVPKTEGFKSYTQYKKKNSEKENIFNENSRQYALQCMAYTGTYGIRQYKGKFCIAIGTAFGASVGTYIDLILENGTVIPGIVSDIKADRHTQANNMVTAHNGCVAEFIVDKYSLPYVVWNTDGTGSGNISHCCKQWNSPVESVVVYNKNIFEEEE